METGKEFAVKIVSRRYVHDIKVALQSFINYSIADIIFCTFTFCKIG